MSEPFVPKLCGGIFLALLGEYTRPRTPARGHTKGVSDKVTDMNTLQRLLEILYKGIKIPISQTWKTNTSDYKRCKKNIVNDMSIVNDAHIEKFSERIEDQYSLVISEMNMFVSDFFDDAIDSNAHILLSMRLLYLIEKDTSIKESQSFIFMRGKITKKNLLKLDKLNFSELLLSVWHYVIVSRKNNRVGEETYNLWWPSNASHVTNRPGGQKRLYAGPSDEECKRAATIVREESGGAQDLDKYTEPKKLNPVKNEAEKNNMTYNEKATDLLQLSKIERNDSLYQIIILDDDYYRAQQYIDALYKTGLFDCEVARDVDDFFSKLNVREYDAYIIDIHMPDRSRHFGRSETLDGWRTGLVVFKKIREIKPDAVVAALTYSEMPEVVEWFTSDENVNYYSKDEYPPPKFAVVFAEFLGNLNYGS